MNILMSIKPEWCKKIIYGEKTIEVRKTKPECITVPFKVYVYMEIWVKISDARTEIGSALTGKGRMRMIEDLTMDQEEEEREREAHDEYVRELLEDFDMQILMMERERL